jgi:hypothetical protein
MLSRAAEAVNRRRPAIVLRWAWGMICARDRSPSQVRRSGRSVMRGLLLAGGRGGRADETFKEIAIEVRRFPLGHSFSGHRGLARENKLRDVGKSDGIASGDTLARELSYEIAEEEIHFIGGCKAVNFGEKLRGEDLRVDSGNIRSETVCVVGAKHRARSSVRGTMILVDQHVAAIAFRADVLAMEVDGSACRSTGFEGHGHTFLIWR